MLLPDDMSILVILEKSIAAFFSKAPVSDQLRYSSVEPKAALFRMTLRPVLKDRCNNVQTYMVSQFKGAHGMTRSETHCCIDGFKRCLTTFPHLYCFEEVGHQQTVHNEPRGVLANNNCLLQGFRENN